MTRRERAMRVARTLKAGGYVERGTKDVRTALVDFLADARHWCDHAEEDYGMLDGIAAGHYDAELPGGENDNR